MHVYKKQKLWVAQFCKEKLESLQQIPDKVLLSPLSRFRLDKIFRSNIFCWRGRHSTRESKQWVFRWNKDCVRNAKYNNEAKTKSRMWRLVTCVLTTLLLSSHWIFVSSKPRRPAKVHCREGPHHLLQATWEKKSKSGNAWTRSAVSGTWFNSLHYPFAWLRLTI